MSCGGGVMILTTPTAAFRAPHRRVECSQSIYYWGEPERAPHRRVARSQSIYICIIGASLSEPHIDELNVRNLYMYVILWYVRHPRAAICNIHSVRDICQCALYTESPHQQQGRMREVNAMPRV